MLNTENNVLQQVDYSTNAILMLNASCQGIVESYINPSSSGWYTVIENNLVTAQRLVREWRNSGTVYFNQDILESTINCGQLFIASKNQIINNFDALIVSPDEKIKENLIDSLNDLKNTVDLLYTGITSYEDKLKAWGNKMASAHSNLIFTVKQVQQQEEDIKSEIDAINSIITSIQQQINIDKDAIAKAKAQEKRAKTETIIGIILVPFTGGVSLILAGIGVASIADAEAKISSLNASIQDYQSKIYTDQSKLNDDNKQIVTLQGLTIGTNTVLDDMSRIDDALDSLKTLWQLYSDDMQNIINKITKAELSDDFIVAKAWFNAACIEWESVVPNALILKDGAITTSHIYLNHN
ncbi:MAG: hypothetical protein A2041_13100 [Bacteroidetes bacterium GWA2_31_9b]|nr:MAG: hypothetical protein A2041_13100 [Bacteroidetes bacterium GWA2_31_9b]